ncbi:hypothetical protein ACYX7E_04785 [Luteimonas sp. RIT-PG2_3]
MIEQEVAAPKMTFGHQVMTCIPVVTAPPAADADAVGLHALRTVRATCCRAASSARQHRHNADQVNARRDPHAAQGPCLQRPAFHRVVTRAPPMQWRINALTHQHTSTSTHWRINTRAHQRMNA